MELSRNRDELKINSCVNCGHFVVHISLQIRFSSKCLTCDQAFFFRRSAKERNVRSRLGGQSAVGQALVRREKSRRSFFSLFQTGDSRVAILSRCYTFALLYFRVPPKKRTPDRRLVNV